MMKKLNKKAFTLIELLVVIAVIGILVLFGAPRFKGHTQRAELTRIQHDIKVMEQEVGTVLINQDDVFNKWEDNNKDFNQLIQEGKLFEKEGPVVEPIDEPYKVIPEKYKDKINTKLKGTFYANSNGKVYYEHLKPLSGIPTEPEKEPGYSEEEIDDLINNEYDFIPVATADELNNVRYERIETYGKGTQWEGEYLGGLDKQYVQVANIDLSEYSEEGSEEGWNPIGTLNLNASNESELFNDVFTGTYDGGNYVIRGLEVEGEIYQGLFGMIAEATIRNVNLIDNKVTGRYVVGGLVGGAYDSSIENSYATGPVIGTVEGAEGVGGLVGTAQSSIISNSYATGSVTGKEFVGGLAGTAYNSTIENSYATGSVKGSGSKSEEDEPILEWSIGNINNSDTTGSENIGGLVGQAGNSIIENSYATGSVTGENSVGGLVGDAWNSTEIRNSYATGSVGGTELVGGLVGNATLNTEIRNSYATGSVGGTELVGGLVGEAEYSTIEKSYSTGSVEGTENVGGLVGWASSNTINNSYATGSVEGTGSWSNVGGLAGGVDTSTIKKSYATGSVESLGSYTYVGGLVGNANASTIEDSYATGSAKGIDAVGGLVGYAFNSIEISNSYATGLVEGEGDWVGGLVGWAQSGTTIENSYWNTETTGQEKSAGGEGKRTDEMKKQKTYLDWDFEKVWKIDEGNDYPKLR